jgi:hypothetical protein
LTNAVVMRTRGFLGLPEDVQAKIMSQALGRIKPDKPNWVVFRPGNGVEEHLEDEGRTLVTGMTGLKEKVYVILDDFGSIEALKKNMGKYAPPGLSTSYVVTFLLAEEY